MFTAVTHFGKLRGEIVAGTDKPQVQLNSVIFWFGFLTPNAQEQALINEFCATQNRGESNWKTLISQKNKREQAYEKETK